MELPVYEVHLGDEYYMVKTWSEVHSLWNEHVWVVGAEDAEMTVKFVSC